MMRLFGFVGPLLIFALLTGCAVTEPDDRDTARVHAAAEGNPGFSILETARDLGISESAVVAAMPTWMRVKLPTDDLGATLAAVCAADYLRIEFAGPGVVDTVWHKTRLRVDSISDTGFVLQSADGTREAVFDPADVAYIWLCRGLGTGPASRVVLFFGSGGERLMAWHIMNTAEDLRRFDRVWRELGE